MNSSKLPMILWAFVALLLATGVLRSIPGLLPPQAVAPLTALLPTVFALVHGAAQYRWRGVLVFSLLCLVVSNAFENLSILTGFPFGHYHYTDSLGPRLFLVPLLIGPGYLGMGYLSWAVARVLLDDTGPTSRRSFAVPLVASVLMTSWDLSFDPVASTVEQRWIWHEGGSYFGVPFSNFLGWFFTVFVFQQLFALYLRERAKDVEPPLAGSPVMWWTAVAMYGLAAVRIVFAFWLLPASAQTVTDPAGVSWRIHDIYAACALVSLFTMVAFTIIALMRLAAANSRISQRPTDQLSQDGQPSAF